MLGHLKPAETVLPELAGEVPKEPVEAVKGKAEEAVDTVPAQPEGGGSQRSEKPRFITKPRVFITHEALRQFDQLDPSVPQALTAST